MSVTWEWYDDSKTATSNICELPSPADARVTDQEMLYLLVDSSHTRNQVQLLIAAGVPPAPAIHASQEDSSPGQQTAASQKTYSFAGFRNTMHVAKWDRLLSHWLPTFDPTTLLTRKISSQAPVGEARGLWVECARAATNLLSQFEVLTDTGEYVPSVLYDQMLMLIRCLPALLLQVDGRDSFHARQQKVIKRCAKFLRGEWSSLLTSTAQMLQGRNRYAETQLHEHQPPRQDSVEKRHERALELTRSLNYSKAMHTLRSEGTSKDDVDDIRQALRNLHPSEPLSAKERPHPGSISIRRDTLEFINGGWLRAQLRKSKKGTAVDQWGWDMREMWDDLSRDDQLLEDIAQYWFRPVAAGYLPEKYREHLAGGRLVALSKAPKPGIRPICVSDAWRRLTAKGLGTACYHHVQEFFQHSHPMALQFGGNNKNGATNMYHLLATIVADAGGQTASDEQEQEPIVLISLDLKNAFNTLSRESLLDFLGYGCDSFVTLLSQKEHDPPLPVGWDLLWRHLTGHYDTHGILKHYHSGSVEHITSEAGVQQGDPLGSTLFALVIHPILIDIAQHNPDILLTGYADNVVISGPLSKCLAAVEMYHRRMAGHGLNLNPAESEAYVPAWMNVDPASIHHTSLQWQAGTQYALVTDTGIALPWRQRGIKVLGCPLGSPGFCKDLMQALATKVEKDISVLVQFPHVHQRIKLATYCANTRAAYFLRAAPLDASRPAMKALDASFDGFWASTLNFEPGYQHGEHHQAYTDALTQIRLGIKQGGCGFTSNDMMAPAALYSGITGFVKWSHFHQDTFQASWMGPSSQPPFKLGHDGHVERNIKAALRDLEEWEITAADESAGTDDEERSSTDAAQREGAEGAPSADHARGRQGSARRPTRPSQPIRDQPGVGSHSAIAEVEPDPPGPPAEGESHEEDHHLIVPSAMGLTNLEAWPFEKRPNQQTICKAIKKTFLRKFLRTLSAHGKTRIQRLGRRTIPARHALSDLAPPVEDRSDTLALGSMNLFSLTCPFELSDEAAVTSTAILLEIPVPHVRFLRDNIANHNNLDVWGDMALNDSVHAANTRKSSHDKIALELASIATAAGVTCTARERDIPYTEQDDPNRPGQTLRRRGDIMTKGGGIVPTNRRAGFTRWTRVVLDVKLGHTFASRAHQFKANSIHAMESLKRSKYQAAYHNKGLAFAPAVCNSWGELGPELLRFLWAVADHAARQHDSASPQGLDPSPVLDKASQDHTASALKRLRGRLYHEYRTRMLCAVLEGVTERVYGRTFALIGDRRYLQWMDTARPLWQPIFLLPPAPASHPMHPPAPPPPPPAPS